MRISAFCSAGLVFAAAQGFTFGGSGGSMGEPMSALTGTYEAKLPDGIGAPGSQRISLHTR
jgi:hypothetical protein